MSERERVVRAGGGRPKRRLSRLPDTDPISLSLISALSMVRVCDDCCPPCRALAAEALGEPVERCGFCGHPVLPELGPCRCMEEAIAADRNKIERRALEQGLPVEEVEAEFRALYERGQT